MSSNEFISSGPFPHLSQMSSNRDDFDQIRDRMLSNRGVIYDDGHDYGLNKPFVDYMNEFLAVDPDAYMFTAYSSIPIADSVRGVYEELGFRPPVLLPIYANRRLSSVDESQLDIIDRKAVEAEVERLSKEANGMRTVVIEQFSDSGKTLRLAEKMLFRAGIINCGGTYLAKWYEEADKGDLKVGDMTSYHADFMKSIGREAARSLQALMK